MKLSTRRTYGQFCAVARTLDLIGERWTLLIVRELIGGPKRYTDIIDALPGIGTSLLAARLKQLEAGKIIVRKRLPPPAASTVYELDAYGEELAEAMLPLALWGARHLLDGPPREGELFRAEWALLFARALLDPERTKGVRGTYEFDIDGSVACLVIDDGTINVRSGEAEQAPDVRVSVDLETFVGVGRGEIEPMQAMADGRWAMEGTPDALQALLSLLLPIVGLMKGRGLVRS